jgi:Endodeoxyribonuclease RusA
MNRKQNEVEQTHALDAIKAQEFTFEDQLEMERQGAIAGINPMFGEWRHHFRFAPVPYGNGAAQRGKFREAIQAELTNQWLYANEIQLQITLHVDVQTVLETDETADLDNYAKAILDGLKGPKGIMIDDTQVQSLAISWIDGYGDPSFEIAARGSPNDFVLKPQEFYEMPDKLWYPHGRVLWTDGRAETISDFNHYAGLSIIEQMSSLQKRVRAEARRAGANRLRAYQIGRYVSTSARGFHRSRIESDFPMHSRGEWQAERAHWSKNEGAEFAKVEEILGKIRVSHDQMIAALTRR